jgi:hypothetical protein
MRNKRQEQLDEFGIQTRVDWKKEEILAHAMVLSQREIIITKR